MVNHWELPTSISVNNTEYAIRTDYRAVMDLLTAFSDKEMLGESEEETNIIRALLVLNILFIDEVKPEDQNEAIKKAIEFIDMGIESSRDVKKPTLMDWEQDAPLIIPGINKVLGREIRADKYMHWWTFLSAYMEIGECSFTHIINIRDKKAKGKKLEKWELEYIQEHKDIVLLKEKFTEKEQLEREAEKNAVNELLG